MGCTSVGRPWSSWSAPTWPATEQNLLFIDRTDGTQRSAVYYDELVRTVDGWRIAARRCKFIVPDGFADRPAR